MYGLRFHGYPIGGVAGALQPPCGGDGEVGILFLAVDARRNSGIGIAFCSHMALGSSLTLVIGQGLTVK